MRTERLMSACKTSFPGTVASSGSGIQALSRVLPERTPNIPQRSRMTWVSLLTRAWQFRYRAVVLCLEGTLTSLGYAFSASLLSDAYGPSWAWQILPHTLPWVVGLRLLSFLFFGTCRLSLRVASVPEFICISKAVSTSSLAFYAITRLTVRDVRLPAALFILDWTVSIVLLVGLHFGIRLYSAQRAIGRSGGKRALIIGAGDAGTKVLKELVLDSGSAILPVGVIDDDPEKGGMSVSGVPVLGGLQDLTRIVREQHAEEVFICIPSATRSQMRFIFARCQECGIPVRTLPSLAELVDGRAGLRDLRCVRIEDVLQR